MRRSWSVVIRGEPASKANSRRVTRAGRFIKSQKALRYVESAKAQLCTRRAKPLLEGCLSARITIYYRTRRPDLDESLILDILQGIAYKNDRQIVEKHIFRGPEAKNSPFAYIEIEELA